MVTTMTKPMLLPTAVAAAAASSSSSSSRRHVRRCTLGAAAASSAALLLASAAWLSLVFSTSSSSHARWPRFVSLDPSPPLHHHLLLSPPPPPAPRPSSAAAAAADDDGDDDDDRSSSSSPLSLRHIVFGIAGSAQLWPRRREFLRLWWRPGAMRGHVWLDDRVPRNESPSDAAASALPPVRVSEDISRFRYTNPTGHPSGLRIARIAAETLRLGPRGARWLVLVDDDTVVCADNLVAVLSKYDWREMVYIGGPSESHSANTYFSHSMAFGGGGIALSYPLAETLAQMQDDCLERYPRLYGSDDRLHACISELGVPLTREFGFHQV